jgi:hypothetical protein
VVPRDRARHEAPPQVADELVQASHPRCRTCRYRLPAAHACELGAADKPALCPRLRKALRIYLPAQPVNAGGLQNKTSE